MFISPAEPAEIKKLVNGTVSSLCEQRGVDFLWSVDGGWCGVQRKTISDLIASVQDGRLQREVGQMVGLTIKALILEGPVQFGPDGGLIANGYGRHWTVQQYRGILWSLQQKGIWVDHSKSISDTVRWLHDFHLWTSKTHHSSIDRRPNPVSVWGKPDHREYQLHLLQGLPGVGIELAKGILDHFGRIPWRWDTTAEELMGIPGIGRKKAEKIMEMLG